MVDENHKKLKKCYGNHEVWDENEYHLVALIRSHVHYHKANKW